MKQQRKKKLLALLVLVFIAGTTVPTFVFAKVPNKITEISEVAEQKSVIDEQTVIIPTVVTPLSPTISARVEKIANELEYNDGWVNTAVNVRAKPNLNSEIYEVYKYNTRVSYISENEDWVRIKYNGSFAYIKAEFVSQEKNQSLSPYTELIDSLSDDEKYLIYQITYLEAGNQSIEGQRAVIEVILNRVLSKEFPDTVYEVLSQPGQFATWEYADWGNYNEEQLEALILVYEEEPILNLDYLMFSTGKFSWAANHVQIGDHWFATF